MSYTVDPELIKLMSAAKGGNKNVSSLLGNLDNSLLTFMAGVYDPLAAQGGSSAGGGGPLWSQYSGDTNPIMRDLMMKIQNGTNKFYLGSYIDSLPAADVQATGYSPSDLKGLATGMLKEYTEGASSSSGASKDPFAKAGLRNPLDLYSTSDMPVGKKGREGLVKITKEQDAIMKAVAAAEAASEKGKKAMGPLFNGFDERGRAKGASVDQMMKYISQNPKLQSMLPKGNFSEDMRQIDPETGDIYSMWGTQEEKGYKFYDPRNLLNLVNIPLKRGARELELQKTRALGAVGIGGDGSGTYGQRNIRDLLGMELMDDENIYDPLKKEGVLKDQTKADAYKKLKRKEGLATGQANAAATSAELYKKGMMRALAETGRTPLGDQMKSLLQFVAQSK